MSRDDGNGRRGFDASQGSAAVDALKDTAEIRIVESSLPPAPRRFIGREDELEQLKESLRGRHPFVTLTGMGGIGKTSLALRAVHDLGAEGYFSDGVIWADGRELQSYDRLLDHLGELLGLADIHQRETDEKRWLIINHLSDWDRLVVFDSFDAVTDDADRAADFVRRLPCAVLITSRAWLSTSDPRTEVGGLSAKASPALFREVGGLDLPHLEDELTRLCTEVLGGHPLAIEIVAAQVRDATVDDVNTLLQQATADGFGREWTGERDGLYRILDWSYHRLPSEAQGLLTRCAVFESDFDFMAVKAISPEHDTLARSKWLQALVSKSLLQQVTPRQMRMHVVTRRFAYDLLDDPARYHRLAAGHFLLEASHDYVAAACQLIYAGEMSRAADVLSAYGDQLINMGHGSRIIGPLSRIDAASLTPQGRFKVLDLREQVYDLLGRREDQEAALQGMADLSQHLDDDALLSDTFNRRSRYWWKVGAYQNALEAGRRALAIKERLGDEAGRGTALRYVGNAHWALGAFDQALQCYTDALEISRQVGDRADEAGALNNIGLIYSSWGDYVKALASFRQALDIEREIGNRRAETVVLSNIARTYIYLGAFVDAVRFFEESAALSRQIGYREMEHRALNYMGEALRNLGRLEEALAHQKQALSVAEELGLRTDMIQALFHLALVHSSLGDEDDLVRSVDLAHRAGEMAAGGVFPDGHIKSESICAYALLALGEAESALHHSQQAIDALEQVGHIEGPEELVFFVHYRALLGCDLPQEAKSYLERAYQILMRKAARVEDEALRESFLHGISENRQLIQTYEELARG